MFKVSYQDLRDWKPFIGQKKPAPQQESFASKEEADKRKHELQAIGVLACVTPLSIRHNANPKGPTPIDGDGPRFNAAWRMGR